MDHEQINSVPPPEKRNRYISMPFVVSVYVILMGCLIFLPFGFAKPSSMGLDFSHYLLMSFFCILFWLFAFVTALVRVQYPLAMILLVSLIVGFSIVGSMH